MEAANHKSVGRLHYEGYDLAMAFCADQYHWKRYRAHTSLIAILFLMEVSEPYSLAGENDSSSVPRRIVAVAPSTAEMICDLGACADIVGVSKFCVHPAELKTRIQVGGLYDPDLEGIIALRPDLLVTRGKHDSLERLAEQLKIPIYHDETDSLAGIERTVRELGALLDRREQAETVVRDFSDRMNKIEMRRAGVKKVRVMLTVSRNPERLSNILTTGRGTFLDEMIKIAGGENVFGDVDMRYPEVSVEAVIARQPDCIVELMPEIDVAACKTQLFEQWSQLSMIPAVKNNRIYFLSDDNALIPSPRYTQFVEKVSRLLHPDEEPK
jgi:iron complex transport system substrate-binding protein